MIKSSEPCPNFAIFLQQIYNNFCSNQPILIFQKRFSLSFEGKQKSTENFFRNFITFRVISL